MYSKKEEQYYVSLINALKKINEENSALYEQLSNNRMKYSFIKYLTHFQFQLLFNRLRIYLYEKKNGKDMQKITDIIYSEPNYFSDKKIAVYTGIYGAYDNVYDPVFIPDNCDFIIFTDQEIDPKTSWRKREFNDDLFQQLNNQQKNRYVKMNPHKLLKEYDCSVYIDGSILAVADFTEFINKIGMYGFALHMHSSRDCVYEELKAAKVYGKLDREAISTYDDIFRRYKMPHHYGMLECGVIARNHRNDLCQKIMEMWWDFYFHYGGRDQLWLPLVLFMNGINIKDISQLGDNIYRNKSFRIMQHKC